MAINKLSGLDITTLENIQDATGSLDINVYQEVSSGSAIYPGRGTAVGLWYCITKLNGEAGEAAEHIGKAFRDDGLISLKALPRHEQGVPGVAFIPGQLTPERRELLLKEVGDCLWYLAAICRELGTTLGAVAVMNLRKLWQRQERNMLQGSGDDR